MGLITGTLTAASASGGPCSSPTFGPAVFFDDCCVVGTSFTGGSTTDNAYTAASYYIDFPCPLPAGKSISIAWDFFSVVSNSLDIFVATSTSGAGCNSLLSVACTTGSGAAVRTIPAGTRRFVVYMTGNCTNIVGGGDQYTLTIICN